jgi:gas vesicle protein
MPRKTSSFEYFAIGFIAGMAVGAAVALLAAPKSGRLMRRDLKRNLEDAGEVVREKVEDQMREIQENLRDVESSIKEVASKVRQKI